MPASGSADVTYSFNVGTTPGSFTAVAYASYDCAYPDTRWINNVASAPTYNIAVVAWFETTGGDVGSRGSIRVSGTPPNHWQSDYVLAGSSVDSAVAYRRWKINNYQKPLIVGNSAYDYLHSRFIAEAMRNDRGGSCNVGSGVTGLVHCSGNVVFGGSSSAPNGLSVWFIDGSLTIEKDLQLGSSDAVVFVAGGPILVKTAVNRIDGVYVTAGAFSDTDSAGGNVASTLVVNGAVYAGSVNFARILATGNDTTPAEQINYRPDFILSLKDLLGSVSMLWREVAP